MDLLKSITSTPYRRGRRILDRLHRGLVIEYRIFLRMLESQAEQPGAAAALAPLLPRFSQWRQEAGQVRADFALPHIASAHERINTLNRELLHYLQEIAEEDDGRRRWLMRSIQYTMQAAHDLELLALQVLPARAPSQALQAVLPTDLLYQCCQGLLPAERMIVVAGRKKNHRIVFGAAFDVTGAASAGHVRADPQRLAQALIAMSSTSSHLAGWFHSHPGEGPESTLPSETDRRQHADWLKDYSPNLLSGVFVRDGHFRLWGTGLEHGTIRPTLVGTGVINVIGEDHVYRILPG